MNSAPLSFLSSKRFQGIFGLVASSLAALGAAFKSYFAFAVIGMFIAACGGIFLLEYEFIYFWILFLTSPLNDLVALPIGGINVRLYVLISLLGFARFGWSLVSKQPTQALEIARHFFWLFLLCLFIVMGKFITVLAVDLMPRGMTKSFLLKHVIISAFLFATTFIVTISINTRFRVVQAIRWWVHLANFIAIYAVIQVIISNVTPLELVWHREVSPIGRPPSLFREPDVLGSYVAATCAMVIPIFASNLRGLFPRWYLYCTIASQGFVMLIAFVRASWIAFILALVLYFVLLTFSQRIYRTKILINFGVGGVLVGILLLGVFAPNVLGTIGERIGSLADPSKESASEYRINELMEMVKHSLPIYNERVDLSILVFGHGEFSWSYWAPLLLGNFYDQNAKELAKEGKVIIHPGFNQLMTIWHDNGLFGLGLTLLFFFALFGMLFLGVTTTRNEITQVILMSTYLPIFVLLVCFIFSYDPISPFFWVLVGLFLGSYYHFYILGEQGDIKFLKEGPLLIWKHAVPPEWRLVSRKR